MIISVINHKGGTGKTTTCVNLSACLAGSGYRVLLVDLDAQASASLSLGVEFLKLSPSSADVLLGETPVRTAIRASKVDGLDLLTGAMELASADLILADAPGRENRLAQSLSDVRDQYDFIVCDCPPSLCMLSVNAMIASDFYLIPVIPEYLALEGLIGLILAIGEIEINMGLHKREKSIVFTMVNPVLKSTREIIGLVRQQYGKEVCQTEIRRNVRLSEAPSFGRDIFSYSPKSMGARDYAALSDEVLKKLDQQENSKHKSFNRNLQVGAKEGRG